LALISVLGLFFGREVRAADAPAPAAKGGMSTFNFNLNTHTSDDVLPFDVRFNVRATVDEKVKSGKLRVMQRPGTLPCDDPSVRALLQKESPRLSDAIVSGTNHELAFVAPALEPNTDYCFAFSLSRALPDGDREIIEQSVKSKLDNTLRDLSPDESAAALVALRASLASSIEDVAKQTNESVKPVAGSIFDPNAKDKSVESRFRRNLLPLLQAQTTVKNERNNFCNTRSEAAEAVKRYLRPDGRADKVLRAIQSRKDSDDDIVHIIDNHGASLDRILSTPLLALVDPECTLNASGRRPIDNRLHESEIDTLGKEMETVNKSFSDVIAVLDALAQEVKTKPKLLPSLNIAPKDVAGVKNDLSTVLQAVGAVQGTLANMKGAAAKRETTLAALATEAKLEAESALTIEATSTDTFTARHSSYVSMDVGLATPWDLGESFTYIGANFYARPINKQAPLRRGEEHWLKKRVSLTLGLTLQGPPQSTSYKPAIGDREIVTAIGWRVLDSVKVVVGGLILKEANRNPLVDRTHLAVTPFVAVSLDWDVKSTFSQLGSALGIP
jgi:hypothetical protein